MRTNHTVDKSFRKRFHTHCELDVILFSRDGLKRNLSKCFVVMFCAFYLKTVTDFVLLNETIEKIYVLLIPFTSLIT